MSHYHYAVNTGRDDDPRFHADNERFDQAWKQSRWSGAYGPLNPVSKSFTDGWEFGKRYGYEVGYLDGYKGGRFAANHDREQGLEPEGALAVLHRCPDCGTDLGVTPDDPCPNCLDRALGPELGS